MSNSVKKVVMRIGRSSGLVPLLFFGTILSVSLTGCGDRPGSVQYSNSTTEAASVVPAISADVQAQAQHQVEQFLANLQQKNYAAIRKQMTPAFQKKAPNTLDVWLKKGRYEPLIGATNWKYDFQSSFGGKKIISHTIFTGADKATYGTNFILSQDNGSWEVEDILSPTKHQGGSSRKVGAAAPPPH